MNDFGLANNAKADKEPIELSSGKEWFQGFGVVCVASTAPAAVGAPGISYDVVPNNRPTLKELTV